MMLRAFLFASLVPAAVFGALAFDPPPPGAQAPGDADDQQRRQEARATLLDGDGAEVGTAELRQTAGDGVLIRLHLRDAPPGDHAYHVHETGRCEPSFSAAGDHYAPGGNDHGFLQEGGPHAGDLPNVHVPDHGELEVEVVAPHLSLEENAGSTVFDEDGSALILHEGGDDYRSQPSGDAGEEIACGVIE